MGSSEYNSPVQCPRRTHRKQFDSPAQPFYELSSSDVIIEPDYEEWRESRWESTVWNLGDPWGDQGCLIKSFFLLLILFEGGNKMAYKLEDGGGVKDIWDMAIVQW